MPNSSPNFRTSSLNISRNGSINFNYPVPLVKCAEAAGVRTRKSGTRKIAGRAGRNTPELFGIEIKYLERVGQASDIVMGFDSGTWS